MSNRIGPPRVIVIGGGLSGLASACRLASRGIHVLLLERQSVLGGKVVRRRWDQWSWQLGPNPLEHSAPVREFWTRLGRDFDAEVPQVPLPPRRCFWEDGRECQLDADFWRQPEVATVLRQAEAQRERRREPRAAFPLNAALFGPSLGTLLDRVGDPHLAQLLRHLACPPGSHPWSVPAVLLHRLAPQALPGERAIVGGVARLVGELEAIARQGGVEIRTRSEALQIRHQRGGYRVEVRDHHSETTQVLDCEGLVCSADASRARRELLGRGGSGSSQPNRAELSLSGFVICLALASRPRLLGPRNLFLGRPQEERARYDQWFEGRHLPEAPTLDLAADNRIDPSTAPGDGDAWVIRTHAPLLGPQIAWESRARSYADLLQARLQSAYGLELTGVRYREVISPREFARHFDAPLGSLHGLAMHGRRALHRVPSHQLGLPRLAFAGASTHPGPGAAAGIQSGNLAAETLLREFKLPL